MLAIGVKLTFVRTLKFRNAFAQPESFGLSFPVEHLRAMLACRNHLEVAGFESIGFYPTENAELLAGSTFESVIKQ